MMRTSMIDPRFVAIVRRHLPLLEAAQALALDTPLEELGLDSMAAAVLVVELERGLGVTLPAPALTSATFATAASLWSAVRGSMEAGDARRA
jgi:acyl carrier protein